MTYKNNSIINVRLFIVRQADSSHDSDGLAVNLVDRMISDPPLDRSESHRIVQEELSGVDQEDQGLNRRPVEDGFRPKDVDQRVRVEDGFQEGRVDGEDLVDVAFEAIFQTFERRVVTQSDVVGDDVDDGLDLKQAVIVDVEQLLERVEL